MMMLDLLNTFFGVSSKLIIRYFDESILNFKLNEANLMFLKPVSIDVPLLSASVL